MIFSYSQRAYTRYEAAIALMVEIGDRNGQIDVLSGMAKSLVMMKEIAKEDSVCECQVCGGNATPFRISNSISKSHYSSMGVTLFYFNFTVQNSTKVLT